MARSAMITPLTMYHIDETIFDGLSLPNYNFPRSVEYDDLFLKIGWTLDKQTLIDNILFETAELEVLYTNPETLKYAISAWSRKEFPVWQSLYETLFYKYNPIWNKDGSIKETAKQIRDLTNSGNKNRNTNNIDTRNSNENIGDSDVTDRSNTKNSNNVNVRNSTDTGRDTDINTDIGTNTNTENNVNTKNANSNKSDETVNKVSAYDENNTDQFSNKDKSNSVDTNTETENNVNVKTGNETHDNRIEKTSDKTNNTNENEVNTGNENENENNRRTYNRTRNENNNDVNIGTENESNSGTEHETNDNDNIRLERGNIGIVTTQAMIEAERELVKFNLYDLIIDSFKARFCLLVY